MWTDPEIYQNLALITEQYGIFQCQECADAISKWLIAREIEGIIIQLRSNEGDFIISNRVGGDVAIAQNGIHVGVEVRGKIFDNLSNSGLSRHEWLSDFECIGGFEVIMTRFS